MELHISNIGKMVTDESLRAIFATYGKVEFIRVINRDNSSNTALIQMPVESEALKAMNFLNGSIINGCMISIQPSNTEHITTLYQY